jgi:hypothetical protein
MTEATMLDVLYEDNALPDAVEQAAWEGPPGFPPDMPLIPVDEFKDKIMTFYRGATEMVPSLVERGGWQLVLRRSEPRYLNIHHDVHHVEMGVGKLSNFIDHFVLSDRIQGPPAGDPSVLARSLLVLAGNPAIREIAAGSRLDPVSIGEMVRAVCSLLTTMDAPSSALIDNSVSIQISADADHLAAEFLSLPSSIDSNQEVLSAVEGLIERHAEQQTEDVDAWAEQLSERLSRFTD